MACCLNGLLLPNKCASWFLTLEWVCTNAFSFVLVLQFQLLVSQFVIIVPADVLAPTSARPTEGALMTDYIDTYVSFKMFWLLFLSLFSDQKTTFKISTLLNIMVLQIGLLTHWGRDKMDAISQTTLSSAFSWMKMFEFWLQFDWGLFLRVQLAIFQNWFR